MPTIGWFEILIIVAIAIIVLGPKDFPLMLKKVGSWIGTAKRYINDIQNEVSNLDIEDEKINEVKKDNKKAFQLYKKAAETGDSRAQFNTGLSLECGRGVKADLKQACYWYKKSRRLYCQKDINADQ